VFSSGQSPFGVLLFVVISHDLAQTSTLQNWCQQRCTALLKPLQSMSACQCSTAYTPSRNALYCCAQVYYVAKQCNHKCSAEEYAIALAKHFVSTYPGVSACCMSICCIPKLHAPLS